MANYPSPVMTANRRISIGIAILGFLYSSAYCDRANIFSAKVSSHSLKIQPSKATTMRTTTTTTTTSSTKNTHFDPNTNTYTDVSSSSSSSLPASSSAYWPSIIVPSNTQSFAPSQQNLYNISSNSPTRHSYTHGSYSGGKSGGYAQGQSSGVVNVKARRNKKNYNKDNNAQHLLNTYSPTPLVGSSSNNKGRQYYISGGWGGWGASNSNLDLYSLLGGLGFLGLLVSLFSYLANRNATTTVVVSGRRRRAIEEIGEELIGESFPEFLSKLGIGLDSPWWWSSTPEVDKKNVTPFKLE